MVSIQRTASENDILIAGNLSHMLWKSDGARLIPQAFPYQGSKRALARYILSLIPDGGVENLVEPFAGSAAISIAARKYRLASAVAISDVNAPLINLWKMIVEQPEQLASEYSNHWYAQLDDPRSYFLEARDSFNRTGDPALLLYLLCRVVKAAVRYSKGGDFNQSADHRRMGAKPANLRGRLLEVSRLMQGASISTTSYEQQLIDAPKDALVYMDPPYQGTTDVPDHRYLSGLERSSFVDNLQMAIDNEVSFVLSYDVVRDDNKYGAKLPDKLGLLHRNIEVGTSSQATLSGRRQTTIESIYVSPALLQRLGGPDAIDRRLELSLTHEDTLF